MGAWGTGPFDNDRAADWAGQLADTPPHDRPELLRTTLLTVLPGGDRPEPARWTPWRSAGRAWSRLRRLGRTLRDDEDWGAEEVVAAACVVAGALPGGPAVDENYGPPAEVITSLEVDEELRALALRAVQEAIGEGSEWHDLWSEAGALDEATTALQPVVDALRRP
ncbi:DUF4259 domain-containing protein [Kineococcus gynurae]|uniref:DUF4259 domain-containing protein n=1 Tax=Kineococcus gynurae TaxID=452979 RepID=A0ABV5LUE6_9ACTN